MTAPSPPEPGHILPSVCKSYSVKPTGKSSGKPSTLHCGSQFPVSQ